MSLPSEWIWIGAGPINITSDMCWCDSSLHISEILPCMLHLQKLMLHGSGSVCSSFVIALGLTDHPYTPVCRIVLQEVNVVPLMLHLIEAHSQRFMLNRVESVHLVFCFKVNCCNGMFLPVVFQILVS